MPAFHPRAGQRGSASPHRRPGSTCLDAVQTAFDLLTCEPAPLAIDGGLVGHGLPNRMIAVDEVRAIVAHPATGRRCRQAVWRHLTQRAQQDQSAWVVAAAGVALPALRAIAAALIGPGQDRERGGRVSGMADVHAAVLTGFVEALRRVDARRPRIWPHLWWAAYRAGAAEFYAAMPPMIASRPVDSQAPPHPWGHPDLVLADAVAKGVLSPVQGELIGRTRLEDVSLAQAATELRLGYEAAKKARQRGEPRLARAITRGEVVAILSPPARKSGLYRVRGPHVRAGAGEPAAARDRSSDRSARSRDPLAATRRKGEGCGSARQSPPPTRPDRLAGPTLGAPSRTAGSTGREGRS